MIDKSILKNIIESDDEYLDAVEILDNLKDDSIVIRSDYTPLNLINVLNTFIGFKGIKSDDIKDMIKLSNHDYIIILNYDDISDDELNEYIDKYYDAGDFK